MAFFSHFIGYFQYIRRTVGYSEGALAMTVATRRVDIQQVYRLHLSQIADAIALHHLGLCESQQLEIMPGSLAQMRLLLHIDRLSECRGQEREVYPEASGQVGHARPLIVAQQTRCHRCLIACGLLAAALLHGDVWRIRQSLYRGP